MLGFVLDFCNTYDLLEDPPDRLSIPLVARHADRSELPPPGLTDDDLERARRTEPALRGLRRGLPGRADRRTESAFDSYGAAPRLVEGPRLAATGGSDAVARLAVASADALARAIAEGAGYRLRTCADDPCRCVYVDRSKTHINHLFAKAGLRDRAQAVAYAYGGGLG